MSSMQSPPDKTAAEPGQQAASDHPSPTPSPAWHPPIALWQLYLLFILTFGVYQLFWAWRFAMDMRRHVEPKVRPWLYVLGLLIPFAPPFLAYRMTDLMARLDDWPERRVGPPRWIVVVAGLAGPIAVIVFLIFDIMAEPSEPDFLTTSILPIAVSPLPWLLLQRQLNRYKHSLVDVAWTSRPYRFTTEQFAALAGGFWVVFFLILGFNFELPADRGDVWKSGALESEATVSGASGLYTLTVPDYGWARAKPGTLDGKADLELLGPTVETWALVHTAKRDGLTMDQLVNARRQLIDEEMLSVSSDEIRVLRSDDLVPVSFARYSNENVFDTEQTFWVATLVADDVVVEVIARTGAGPIIVGDIERLVKSLTLVEKAERQ